MFGRIPVLILLVLSWTPVALAGGFPANQPFASFWFPNELLEWSPATDPDAPYNRATVPLQDRFLFPGTQVNSHARADEAEIVALSIMYPSTSFNPSQGARDFDVFAFNYWQYITSLTFWGGSAGEGLILAPNPGVIDAAHRNGVEVLGTIFFPPIVFGGQLQWVIDFVQTDGNGGFPVADKLIEVAEYYGFEGWFINQETNGGNAILATQVRDVMRYIEQNSDLKIMWYDAMIESGPVVWQNQLNAVNDAFFHENNEVVSEQFFLNFFWNQTRLINSRTVAQSYGRSEYKVYAGADVQANGYNTGVNWGAVFPEGEPHRTSFGLFAPNWTYTKAIDNDDFYQRANRFWVGANRDPSNTETTQAWRGLAHYVPAWSAINSLPFVTHFNTGQGHLFSVDGEVLAGFDWNNRGLQEILPTWRWILQPASSAGESSSGVNLVPEMDWTESYYGGTSLKISGDLNAAEELVLYKTQLPVSANTNLQLAYKTGTGGASNLAVGLAFEAGQGLSTTVFLNAGDSTTNGWNVVNFDLAPFAGQTLATISLLFEAVAPVPNYQIHIGRLGLWDVISDSPPDAPAPPTAARIEGRVEPTPDTAALRLRWNESPDETVWYNVYRRNPDDTVTYLGSSGSDAAFIAEVQRVDDEETTTIEVEAVGPTYLHSTRATTTFIWEAAALLFSDGFESGDATLWEVTGN